MADQSPRDQPEGFDQSSSPTVPRLNMLQTIPNNFFDLEFNRFILWVISSVVDSTSKYCSTTVTVLLPGCNMFKAALPLFQLFAVSIQSHGVC